MVASLAREHADWLKVLRPSGPFVSIPVLMRVFGEGLDRPADESARRDEMRRAYAEWQVSQAESPPDVALHTAWIRFVLERLLNLPADLLVEGPAIPAHLRVSAPEHGETLAPDLALVAPEGHGDDASRVRLVITRYPATQELERDVPQRTWAASPSRRMEELLRRSHTPLGLVTNGEDWLLVSALPELSAGFATWRAADWSPEPQLLRAFWSLLGMSRFFGVPDDETLPELIAKSAEDQQEVTDQLGYQVRRAVEVLIQTIDRVDQDRDRTLLVGQEPAILYEAALTVMMRLVFLFCAEERGLLLLGEELYDTSYAVSPLRDQLRAQADQHGEEVLERYSDAWARLLATFRAVHAGVSHDAMPLPAYGGHLLDPDRYPFLEGRFPGTTWRETEAKPLPIDNRTVLHLLEALQLLQVRVPGGGPAEAQRLSFRALDIEQIGHVYEGLLDHTAKRATAPVLGLDGARDAVAEVPLAEIEEKAAKGEAELIKFLKEKVGKTSDGPIRKGLATEQRPEDLERLRSVCGNDAVLFERIRPYAGLLRKGLVNGYPVVYPAGSVYVTAGTDRRSTGTHYTPRSLTEPIVKHTLDPLCYLGPAEGHPESDWTLRPARELLALKICDLAMGSGAFLVQAARYLAEQLMTAWTIAEDALVVEGHSRPIALTPEGTLASHSGDTVLDADPEVRRIQALRLICDRCLYGVDRNPMAVEMAKLSLWLVTLDKGRPFTFLDHALRCGDSLLGISDMKQLRRWNLLPRDETRATAIDLFEQTINRALSDARRLRHDIETLPTRDVRDLEQKERMLALAEEATDLVKLGADLLVGSALAPTAKERDRIREGLYTEYVVAVQVAEHQRQHRLDEAEREAARANRATLRARADELLGGRRPFHWPLEFPEVFDEDTTFTPEVKDGHLTPTLAEWTPTGPGFAAIVGNPPFMGGKKITGPLGSAYREYLVDYLASGVRGHADLCAYFFLRAGALLRVGGDAGLLATNTIAQGDTREVGLDQLASRGYTIPRANPSHPWPGAAALEVAHVWLRRGSWHSLCVLDGQSVVGIDSYLAQKGATVGNAERLASNANRAFAGTVVLGTGFLLTPEEAEALIAKDSRNRGVLFPYLNGEDLNSRPDQSPSRRVINFHDWPLDRAETYADCMAIIREKVKPQRDRNNKVQYRTRWWQFAERCPGLYAAIAGKDLVLVACRVSKYVTHTWVPNGYVYDVATNVFANVYAGIAGILQSSHYQQWVYLRASTMRTDTRYTVTDCFETFPFPDDLSGLDRIGERYYAHRQSVMLARQEGLTKTYNRFHDPGEASNDIAELRSLHMALDEAVAQAYGWDDLALSHGFHQTKQGLRFTISEAARREVLDRLLRLNHERHAAEVAAGLVDAKGKVVKGKKKGPRLPTPSLLAWKGGGQATVAAQKPPYQAGLFGED